MQITHGWLDLAQKKPSPNYNERPISAVINLLVIHNISLPPACFGTPFIEDFFQNQLDHSLHTYFQELVGLEVSSHFLIKRSGQVTQFVSCDDRAWHAGVSQFCGQANCNDFSIGIELEGTDTTPYTDEQYESLLALTRAIQQAYPEITKERITGHQDIAPGRKTDPGECFDWPRYLKDL